MSYLENGHSQVAHSAGERLHGLVVLRANLPARGLPPARRPHYPTPATRHRRLRPSSQPRTKNEEPGAAAAAYAAAMFNRTHAAELITFTSSDQSNFATSTRPSSRMYDPGKHVR